MVPETAWRCEGGGSGSCQQSFYLGADGIGGRRAGARDTERRRCSCELDGGRERGALGQAGRERSAEAVSGSDSVDGIDRDGIERRGGAGGGQKTAGRPERNDDGARPCIE